MKNYRLRYDYTDLGGNGDWQIWKRKYVFFGLIPSDWQLEFYTPVEEVMATWINENVKVQSERIRLKIELYGDPDC